MSNKTILAGVNSYYSDKIARHGATPQGVDWNSAESQALRFRELLTICTGSAPFSILDFGCGYGALLDQIALSHKACSYIGFDISEPMIGTARELHSGQADVAFTTDRDSLGVADYAVASGIFNVRLNATETEWKSYIIETLEQLDSLSKRGFAFNMLTSYSDAEKMRSDLHYGDPCFYFDHCKKRYSKQVALLHDYGLYEFTVLVRKQEVAER